MQISALILLAAFLALPAAAAEPVGKMLSSQGVTTLQRPGAVGRITGPGETLLAGDVLSTGPGSVAMIELADGSRMTLRPATIFTVENMVVAAGQENASLRLFKGGLRALTGFLSKRNPDAVRVYTATATVGIRGTDFDARICGKDCQDEAKALAGKGPPVIARVAMASGSTQASNAAGERRPLVAGAGLHNGETLETGSGSTLVVVFADETRLTLQADARFRLEDYRYRNAGGEADRSVFRLLKGAMRMVTGAIGKKDPSQVRINTLVAIIGIRGTGLDSSCGGACAGEEQPACEPGKDCAADKPEDGLFLHTWSGLTELVTAQGTLPLPAGSTGFVGARGQKPSSLPTPPAFIRDNPAPRPDSVPAQPPERFGTHTGAEGGAAGGDSGLHVWVRDGQVTLDQAGDKVALGPGQAGFAGPTPGQIPLRLEAPPAFMRLDPTPRPTQVTISLGGAATATLAKPASGDSTVCEVK